MTDKDMLVFYALRGIKWKIARMGWLERMLFKVFNPHPRDWVFDLAYGTIQENNYYK